MASRSRLEQLHRKLFFLGEHPNQNLHLSRGLLSRLNQNTNPPPPTVISTRTFTRARTHTHTLLQHEVRTWFELPPLCGDRVSGQLHLARGCGVTPSEVCIPSPANLSSSKGHVNSNFEESPSPKQLHEVFNQIVQFGRSGFRV